MKRFEDARLIAGNGVFIDDIKLPDMLHAAVVRSVHAHARIRSIDVAAARGLAGIVEVLTGADLAGTLPDIPIRPMGDRSVDEFNAPEHPVLAREKVCYVGQPVAVVVAHDPYLARDGAELVAVDYDPLSPVMDPDEAASGDVPVIHPDLGTNVAMRSVQQGGNCPRLASGMLGSTAIASLPGCATISYSSPMRCMRCRLGWLARKPPENGSHDS